MDSQKKDKFCMAPFVMLSTSADGHFRACSEMQTTDAFNFHTTKNIKETWNCNFLKKIRIDLINNRSIENCSTCYYSDQLGIPNKRTKTIQLFYEKFNYIIEEAKNNNGELKSMPKWWELRLSNLCNLGCRICIPRNSSFLQKEFSENQNDLPENLKKFNDLASSRYSNFGHLEDDDSFLEQFFSYANQIEYLELHGGEPLLNNKLWSILEKLVSLDHAKNIHLCFHTNLTILTDKHLNIMNQFKNGRIDISIDAYQEENEYIRYPSKWNQITSNVKKLSRLTNWQKTIGTSICAYQACTIDKLLWWLDDFLKCQPELDIMWFSWPVVKPDYLRIEIIPFAMRQKTVTKLKQFIQKSYLCNHSKRKDYYVKQINVLIINLSSTQEINSETCNTFIDFTIALDKIRNQNILNTFPHLVPLFKEFYNGDQ